MRFEGRGRSALVVISHYNAWPADQLVALLDQTVAIPAGMPFRTRVVVNQAEPRPLELPARHAGVEVIYRPNRGYNIGAWDHGWRAGERFDDYLFLQEECVIQRPGWLLAFARRAARPGVGLVGESRVLNNLRWTDAGAFGGWLIADPEGGGSPTDWATFTRGYLTRRGIAPGLLAEHLQALVIFGRREVLEAMDGFRSEDLKDYAIGCEVAMSKDVEAVGLATVQVRIRPFHFILHPQWSNIRAETRGWRWLLGALLLRGVPPARRVAWKRRAARLTRRPWG